MLLFVHTKADKKFESLLLIPFDPKDKNISIKIPVGSEFREWMSILYNQGWKFKQSVQLNIGDFDFYFEQD